jgi:Asp-tRNA(Asn)/Glu-tRNA(Gln) amidotransferase A subunit family amidase
MARHVADLQLLFSVLAGFDPEDPFSVPAPLRVFSLARTRIGVWEQFYDVPVMPEIRAPLQKAARALESLGMGVEEFTPEGLERAPNVWAFLFSQWPSSTTRKLAAGRESELHWTLRESLSDAQPTGEEVILQLATRDRMRAALLRQMEEVPVILMPVAGIPAFRHRERKWAVEGKEIGLFRAMIPALIANVLGLPALTVPVETSAGKLPVGVQLLGRPFEDERLLELGCILQDALS